jgi:hypothetical protein
MNPPEDHEIIRELKEINAKLEKQNSFSRLFLTGIIYGVGFFIGSAIIATIAFGIIAPLFAKIPWIRDAFLTGITLLHR